MCLSITRSNTRALLCSLCVAIAIAVSVPAGAEESDTDVVATTPGTSYSRSVPGAWRGATKSKDAGEKKPGPSSSLTIRIYEGIENFRPYYGDEPAYGVDVSAEIEHCPDGHDRIRVLNIGGWLYEVDGNCSDHSRWSGASADGDGRNEHVMHCDPATWRCRTVGR